MLDDFHESTRSVGIAGFLLGLLVLAGFCGLGMAVMSGNAGSKRTSIGAKVMDQERVIEHLTGRLEDRKMELEKAKAIHESMKISKELSMALATENEGNLEHQESVTGLNNDLVELQKNFEKYRSRYRINERAFAVGETLDLSETMGEGFKKCQVIGVSPLHLRVMASSGPVGIEFEKLPFAVQDRFQFAGKEASTYQERVNQAVARRGEQEAVMKKRKDKNQQNASRRANLEALARIESEIMAKTRYASQQDDLADDWYDRAKGFERKAAQAKAAGRISMGRGQATTARKTANGYQNRANRARSEINQLMKNRVEYERKVRPSRR